MKTHPISPALKKLTVLAGGGGIGVSREGREEKGEETTEGGSNIDKGYPTHRAWLRAFPGKAKIEEPS